MENFLGCDWGTSSFRLRLVEASSVKVLAEIENDKGSAETFKLWKLSGLPEQERIQFYQSVISESIKELEAKVHYSLKDVPMIISGMASSTIGMMNLPYKEVPFLSEGSDLEVKVLEAETIFPHKTLVISGAKTADDVMRGEETKLIGCNITGDKEFLILPGTHPKHVAVRENKIVAFKTYMTGEFFKLLSKESILASSVEPGGDFNEAARTNFVEGVIAGEQSNFLHQSFLVRTNNLFNKNSKQENLYYLSGLLIGAELKEVRNETDVPVILLGGESLTKYYRLALEVLGIPVSEVKDADEALIRGQAKIYSLYKNH